MSFFDDFLKEFLDNDDNLDIKISMVFNKGVAIVGELAVYEFDSEEIKLLNKKQIVEVIGDNLQIKSMCKGEFIIVGNVKGVYIKE